MGLFDVFRRQPANPILAEAEQINNDVTAANAPQFIPLLARNFGSWSFDGYGCYNRVLQDCSPMAAIVLMRAKAFTNGAFEVLNPANDNYVVGYKKEWVKLLNSPNKFTSRSQFFQRLAIELDTWNYCYIMPTYSYGFEDIPESLYILPNEFIEIELVDPNKALWEYGTGDPVRRIFFNFGGSRNEIDESKLILIKGDSLIVNPFTLLPASKMRSLHHEISLFVSSEVAAITLVQNRGAMGILSNKSKDQIGNIAMPNSDKAQLQSDWRRYGLTPDQWQILIASQDLSWVQIGMDITSLQLEPNKLNSLKSMCFVYGIPDELQPWTTNSTYDNVKLAERRFYQNEIIPWAVNITEQLNRGLKIEKSNAVIKVSYKDVACFQQTLKEEGEARQAIGSAVMKEYQGNVITYNRMLEILGEDQVENGDYYYYQSPEYLDQQIQIEKRLNSRNAQQNKGTTA